MKVLMRGWLCFMLGFFLPAGLLAHGTVYEVLDEGPVGVQVSYESGEPLARCRVLVFPPGETAARYELLTDDRGVVCLLPDVSGDWILQVRDASGHGARINLSLTGGAVVTSPGGGGFSWVQKLVMAVCVVIGLAGIALYFKRKR